MEILRRNTDYALRAMVNLAKRWGTSAVSTKEISLEEQIPYQLTCKLMQKLQKAGLVQSLMGPKGGFSLNKDPKSITLLEMVVIIQGAPKLNRCLLGSDKCRCQKTCSIRLKIDELQNYIENYLGKITLDELANERQS
jgi:Rrf2 family protein